ncbi:MAG: dihydroorotase [Acidimicrobiia bacterium]
MIFETLLIRGCEVVGPDGVTQADLLIEDGRILKMGRGIRHARARVIDASGMLVFPGLVDMHTHLREPGQERSETIETACRAAVAGGYTAVVAMPNTNPPVDSPEIVVSVRSKANAVRLVDVEVAACVTRHRSGYRLTEMGRLAGLGVRLFTDDGTCVRSAAALKLALTNSARMGFIVADHPEEPSLVGEDLVSQSLEEESRFGYGARERRGVGCINEGEISSRLGLPVRPREAETVIVSRDLAILAAVGGRLHLQHLSTSDSFDLLKRAKESGLSVTAEVAPHHLVFTEEAASGCDPVYKVNPPLRTRFDLEAAREALVEGVVDVVATDHAPHAPELKELAFEEAPAGIASIEIAFSLLYTELVCNGVLSIQDLVRLMSSRPAEILGLEDHGGPLQEGSAANVAVFDPSRTWEYDPSVSYSKAKASPYAGRKFNGRVVLTIYRGQVVFEEERSGD